MSKYEVQTYTVCDGWMNTWHIHHDDGTSEPETFASYSAAWGAVMEFIEEIDDEIRCGQREADEVYCLTEFRVWPVSVEGSA